MICLGLMMAFAPCVEPCRARAAGDVETTGVLRIVDPQGRSIILKKPTGDLAELPVAASAEITLDGKPIGLDGVGPGIKAAVTLDPASGAVRSLKAETEPVRLRISVSRTGDCRVALGRSIPPERERPGDGLVPITTSYADSFVGGKRSGSTEKGSSRFQADDPKSVKSSTMLLYPRALRLPCSLSLDIPEFKDGYLGVQFLTPTANFVVSVESDDDLKETAKLVAVASGNDVPGQIPTYGNAQRRVKVEQPVRLSQPEQVTFKLPLSEKQIGDLYTLDVVLRARPGRENPKPSLSIRNTALLARDDRTLGLVMGVERGKAVVERVDPAGLAAGVGLKAGDVVASLGESRLPTMEDAGGLTSLFLLGSRAEARLTVMRGGKEQVVTIKFD
jgi:hypothetical protein